MEELLKIAKENYPAGTVFKSAFDPQNTQIVEGNWENVSNGIIVSPGATYIYYKENWAKIISKPEVKEETKKDNINPSHYQNGKVECIDALESATINKTGLEAVCTANVIKYLWRYEDKNGLEDIKKAQWYLNKLISHVESKSN